MNQPLNPIAHCSPEIADWIDPTGALRQGGLLVVDMPPISSDTMEVIQTVQH